MDEKEWYTVKEFAAIAGYSVRSIQAYCLTKPQIVRAKRLGKKGSMWLINTSELKRWDLLDNQE